MNDMIEIRSVTYARSTLPEDMVFFDGDGEKRIPITFLLYVITMGERRILVDAGCDTMPGFVMEGFITPAQALQNAGIDPKRITDVIVTHSHHDHAQGIHHFENAVIYLQETEYKAAKGYIPEHFRVVRFEEEYTVADRINIRRIGGHSAGSCIVELKTEENHYVFSGDECYSKECLDRKRPTGASVKKEKSRAFIEKYSAPQYTVLLAHDPACENFLRKEYLL